MMHAPSVFHLHFHGAPPNGHSQFSFKPLLRFAMSSGLFSQWKYFDSFLVMMMFRISIGILIVLKLTLQSVCISGLEYDGALDIKLEHLLNPDEALMQYQERGNISVQSIRTGQTRLNQKPLTTEESLLLEKLAISNDFYKVKATISKDSSLIGEHFSTLKACMLAEAELDDRLSIFVDYAGKVVSFSQIIASKTTCEGASVSLTKLKYFTSNIYVRHTENGPIPDTASHIQRLEREKEAKEKGEVKDNRSFLAKYWMYIIPVVILMVISSASNTENTPGGATT